MPLNYVDICIALYDYTALTDDELTFHEDDVLYILENDDEDWWKAKLKIVNVEGAESSEEERSIGLVPRNYIQPAECTAVLKALWDYEANSEEELSFKEDDMLNLYEEDEDGWYLVKFNNLFGMIPPNYVEKVSMDSVGQDAQEENYEDEEVSENQTNQSKTVSCFDAVSSPSDQNNTYVDPLKLYAVKASRPKAGSSASESKRWPVTEVVGDKKKQKKKGTLVIGNGIVIFASGSDKAPVRQWEISDIIDIKKDKKNKNISFTFRGSKGGTIEFQAHKNIITEIYQKSEDCRASLEIPTVKVNNTSSIRSSIASTTLSTSSRPSSTHKSIESEEPQNELEEQYEEQDNKPNSHQNLPEEEEEEEEEEAELASPKFGVALYDFDAQGDDEVSIREGDELWIIDDVSSEEWWKVRKDDEEGVVPASFIELRSEEDNETEKAAQAAAEAAVAEAAAEAERHRLEEERIKREEEKSRRQREEEERKRREAEKRVQEEKKQKAAAQSQPPPPPPVFSNRPVRANPSLEEEAVKKIQTPANRALPERPLQAQSKSKPIPSNTRTWTDRTGTFKVEAQFLQLVDGKVHLHKLNGVKISVPVDKMSKEDLAYLEEVTGEKVYDKNDDTPLAAIAAAYKGKARLTNNYVDYDWYDFFLNAGVSHEDAFEYAKMFLAEKMDESSISDLNRDVMKGLGIKEGDIIRIKKYIDQKYNSGKKRTVSFGTTSVIPDDIDRQSTNKQSARKTQSEDAKKAQQLSEFDVKMQMKRDEQFARELQEEENRIARSEGRQIPKSAELYGNLDSIIQREEKKTPTTTPPQLFSANNGVLKNNTKKARPQPTKTASIQIDAKTLVNAKGSFNEAFKSSSLATSSENKFDDDAWVSKDLTPPLVPTVKAPTPPPPPPPPPPSSISQTPPSVPVRPSNLLSSSNLSLNSSTPVNQNQISPRLPLVTPGPSNPGPNTTGQFSMNWNSSNSSNMNNIQSSQPIPPPPPPPQQSIVIPLNNTLHPPLIPSKPFPSNTNNTQGNNMLSTMNIQRPNSTSSFQGMSTGNLSGSGGNFNSSTSAWNSTSLTSNPTPGYSLPNQFNSNTNQLQQLQIQQTTIQLQQLQLQSSSNQSQQLQQLQSQQSSSSKYDPQNVFASMKAGQFGPIAPTNNLGANSSQDRYSVFKQVDPSAPSIFNNPNSAINPSSGMGFNQNQGGFVNSNPANWNQNNFRGTSVPQQTSNFGIQQNPGFGFGGQPNQLNPQGFNPNQGLNNLGLNNQGFNTNPGFNNNNQQNPGGFNKQW